MQLDFVSDDIGDHAPLDTMVYAECESDCNKEPHLLGMILAEDVASASDKMDKKFLNIVVAQQILEEYSADPGADENSNLKKLLRWCWKRGSFDKIRRLSEHSSTTYAISHKPQKSCGQWLCIIKRIGRKVAGMHNVCSFTHRLIYFTCLVFRYSKVRYVSETSLCLLIVC